MRHSSGSLKTDYNGVTVNSLLFTRTLFSLIFASLTTLKFKIHAKYLHI